MRCGSLLPLLLLLLSAGPAAGHGMRTAYLDVSETTPGSALLRLHGTVPDESLLPVAPADCRIAPEGVATDSGSTFLMHCPGPLAGRSLSLRGLGPVHSEAVVRVALYDGGHAAHVLLPGAAPFVIPGRAAPLAQALRYAGLGLRHILSGPDHLLFLVGLLLLLRRPGAVLLAESAFTLSHSLSFSAVALGWLQVAPAAAEACIALSLVLLALDLPMGSAVPSWGSAPLRGASLALAFGLVHGLGFAGGLRDIGIPEQDVGAALLGFALGVEVGQLAFLLICLLGYTLLSRTRAVAAVHSIAAYVIGVTGSYWLLVRLAELS